MADKREKRALVKILKYLLICVAGIALGVWLSTARGFKLSNALYLNARYLSDGLFAVGFIIAGLGALVLVSTLTDFYDIFTYGVKSLIVLFTALRKPKEHISYYDYKTTRAQKRGKPSFTLLISGLIILALSAASLAAYYGFMPE